MTTAAIPQHLDALATANAIRLRRAQAKRDMHAGTLHPLDLLSDLPDWADTWPVQKFLCAIPGIARQTMVKIVREVGCSETRKLGTLTTREMARLRMAIMQHEGRIEGFRGRGERWARV